MATLRQRTGNRLAGSTNRPAARKIPTRQFPILREIQKLEDELNALQRTPLRIRR